MRERESCVMATLRVLPRHFRFEAGIRFVSPTICIPCWERRADCDVFEVVMILFLKQDLSVSAFPSQLPLSCSWVQVLVEHFRVFL